jgi:hypothetical protein
MAREEGDTSHMRELEDRETDTVYLPLKGEVGEQSEPGGGQPQ